jgi:hypothetical protein
MFNIFAGRKVGKLENHVDQHQLEYDDALII